MNGPRDGDRVRVTYEGTYRETSDYAGHIVTFTNPDGEQYRAGVPKHAAFEVLAPPVKVGDVRNLDKGDNLGDLPDGAVIRGVGSGYFHVKQGSQWYGRSAPRVGKYRIEFIPGGTQ